MQNEVQMRQIYKVRQPNEVVSDQICHEDFFHYVNPKNKYVLTPLHMATINIQSLKYVNIVLQKRFKKRWLLYMIISAIFNLVLQFVPK